MNRTLISETKNHIGEEVTLMGFVSTVRSHGKISFIDLRDRTGVVQMVETAGSCDVSHEDVIKVVGLVKKRPPKMINPKIDTGEIEIEVKTLEGIAKAKELPFPIDDEGYDIGEEIRLKYRYLDLR